MARPTHRRGLIIPHGMASNNGSGMARMSIFQFTPERNDEELWTISAFLDLTGRMLQVLTYGHGYSWQRCVRLRDYADD